MEENKTAIVKFNPIDVRDNVVKHMESMQTSKFVQLPDSYKESAFFAIEKLSGLQDIEKVPSTEIAKALINMYSNGLDFRKNHCYFFVQNDKNTGKSLRFGWQYQGLIFVGKNKCKVVDVIPVIIYENDTFETHYEYGALIIDKHIPTFEGNIKGGYCVVEFNDGKKLIRYYTKAEMEMRRDKSMAKNGSFWKWEREMYEKTLINATLKRIIETSSDITISGLYDESEVEQRQTAESSIIQQKEPIQSIAEPIKVQI